MAIPRITKEELKERLESGDPSRTPVVLDVRLKYPYEHSTLTLPGAIRVFPLEPDFSLVPSGREVVAYDSDPEEMVSAVVVAQLLARGVKAAALKGGITDWMAANLPTVPKDAPRQAAPVPGALKG